MSVLEDISQREVLHEHDSIPLPIEVQNAMKKIQIANLPVTIKSLSRPISILLATISILFILLLLVSGIILTIQTSSMLLNCAFYPKKVTSACQRNTRIYASWMLLRISSAWLLLIDANQSSSRMVYMSKMNS